MATTEEGRQAEVDAACEAVLARGDRPTVDRVREYLGGGSPNKLTPLVRAWKERRKEGAKTPPPLSLDTGQKPVETPAAARPAVDALSSAVEALRGAVDGLPRAFVQVAAAAAETERRRSDLEIQSIKAASDAQVREVVAETADERGLVDLLRQEVDTKDAELADLGARLAAAAAEAQDLRAKLGEEIARSANLQSSLTQATAKAGELEGLLESAKREASAAATVAADMHAEAKDLNAKRDALQAQLMERSAEMAETRTGIAVAQQTARSAEAAAKAAEEARDAAVRQTRADAERAGAAEARAQAVEEYARRLEANLERLQNARSAMLERGVSPFPSDAATRQARAGKRRGSGAEAAT